MVTHPGATDELTLRIVDAAHLEGATVALAAVGGPESGLTRMTLQLAAPFGSDGDGGRQLLAASTFVGESTALLTGKLRNAA